MKMIYYKYKKNRKNGFKNKNKKVSIERLLYLSLIITFVILVIVQAALTNPTIRTYLTVNGEYEGTQLASEEYTYDHGTVELALLRGEVDGSVRVLVNGTEAAAFAGKELSVQVKQGDVIEIDSSTSISPADVEIVSCTGNVSSQCIGKRVQSSIGIKKLIKVQMD
ncbi:MAG: hypothetical protein Q8920_07240 [Bacillota bacterium]|nr:hypothetical protein [Bacillota bacterium]